MLCEMVKIPCEMVSIPSEMVTIPCEIVTNLCKVVTIPCEMVIILRERIKTLTPSKWMVTIPNKIVSNSCEMVEFPCEIIKMLNKRNKNSPREGQIPCNGARWSKFFVRHSKNTGIVGYNKMQEGQISVRWSNSCARGWKYCVRWSKIFASRGKNTVQDITINLLRKARCEKKVRGKMLRCTPSPSIRPWVKPTYLKPSPSLSTSPHADTNGPATVHSQQTF